MSKALVFSLSCIWSFSKLKNIFKTNNKRIFNISYFIILILIIISKQKKKESSFHFYHLEIHKIANFDRKIFFEVHLQQNLFNFTIYVHSARFCYIHKWFKVFPNAMESFLSFKKVFNTLRTIFSLLTISSIQPFTSPCMG